MVVDLRPFDAELTGKVAQATLDEAGITLNKNTIPDDPQPVRHQRPAHRHTVGHDTGDGGTADGRDRLVHRHRPPRPGQPAQPWVPSAAMAPRAATTAGVPLGPAHAPWRPRLCSSQFHAFTPYGRASRGQCHARPTAAVRPDSLGSRAVPSTGEYLIIGAVAGVATFLVTPLVAALARWRGGCTSPTTARSTPSRSRPSAVWRCTSGSSSRWRRPGRWTPSTRCSPATPSRGRPAGGDDHRGRRVVRRHQGVSAPAKVTGTVVAGLALVWLGVTMYYFRLPFLGVFVLSDDWVPLITVLWLLGMTQAINLIDGLDGLAAGIVAIGAGAFFLYSQRLSTLELLRQPNIGPLMAIVAVGLCVGSCRTTSTRRASSWATAAPCCSAC